MAMKKMISLALATCLALSLSVSVGAVEDEKISTDEARAIEVLLKSGWTEEEIKEYIPKEGLLQYADALPAVATDERFVKVSEDADGSVVVTELPEEAFKAEVRNEASKRLAEELQNSNAGLCNDTKDTVTTSGDYYLTYYVQALPSSKAKEYVLSARYQWLIAPDDRKIDVFGLGHDGNLTQTMDPVTYVYKTNVYMIASGNKTLIEEYQDDSQAGLKKDTGGTAVKQQLYKNSTGFGYNIKAEGHKGYIQYKVKVNSSTAKVAAVYAEYLHQTATISVTPNISYPIGGSISVSSENKFERLTPNPYLMIKL